MKKTIVIAGVCIFSPVVLSNLVYAQGAWINGEGCYCGIHPWTPVTYECKGSGSLLEKAETLAQAEYWNRYAGIFDPCVDTGMGAPENGRNEVNTFITPTQARNTYGMVLDSDTYGVMLNYPNPTFGIFNDCRDTSFINCGAFIETDVLLNAGFSGGWTTDPTNFTKALVQTTALHEIGHSWGAHHVFNLSGYAANAYSCMNYMSDYGGRYVTRMDANTIRDAYSNRERSVTDFGVYPLSYWQGQYAEDYASTYKTSYSPQDPITINPITVQNCGVSSSANLRVSFYLSADSVISSSDSLIGSLSWNADNPFPVNGEWTGQGKFFVPDVGRGYYYVGAIITNWGNEDSVTQNNKCVLVDVQHINGDEFPINLRRIYVTNWYPRLPTTPVPTPKPTSPPTCEEECVSWCDDNYVELSVSLTLSWDCSFSDVDYYGVPVNVFLALIQDPVVTDDASTTGQALAGGAVYLFTDKLSGNYLFRGRVHEPTWSYVSFPPVDISGSFDLRISAPPGNYVFATAFVNALTGSFIRSDLQVENSNRFTIR
jgi:hypothetical protein